MPFVLFRERFRELAERETRTVMVFEDSGFDLPAGDYGFVELFCDEVGCDCRRTFLWVFSTATGRREAVLNFGWEDAAFYARWLKRIDPAAVKELQGPSLAVGMPQGEDAEAILAMARDVLLGDPAYVARLQRHYAMFRATVDQSGRGVTPRRKVGRNDPCPCGSGRKYKKCCERVQEGAGSESPARSMDRRAAASGERLEARMVPAKDLRFSDEVDYIVDRAIDGDARLVRLGRLALFSTATGDAWVLDPEDSLALPLLLGGERSSAGIVEDGAKFAIEFTHDYRIDRGLFVVEERESGTVRAFAGYPLRELAGL